MGTLSAIVSGRTPPDMLRGGLHVFEDPTFRLLACGALECPQVMSRLVRRDAREQHCGAAFGARVPDNCMCFHGGRLNGSHRSTPPTGGSATELSAADAWHRAAVDGAAYVRLISTIARSNFRQNAWNVEVRPFWSVATY